MQLSELDVISWDVDGTLYSSSQMIKRMFSLSFTRFISSNPRRTYQDLAMLHHVRRNMRQIRKKNGDVSTVGLAADLDDRLRVEERWYGEAIKYTGLHAGVEDVIKRFDAAGLRQVIVSDYEAHYKLRILEIDSAFEAVYAGETIGFVKPSPNLFNKVAADLNVEPRRILHIGNHEHLDGKAAREADCQAVIFGEDFATFFDLFSTLENIQVH